MNKKSPATPKKATFVREIAVEGVRSVHGVTYDGKNVWFADATRGGLAAVDAETGETVKRLADVPADAGTAFDGTYLYQLAGDRIQKVDPSTGKIVRNIPAPGEGRDSGLTWAEGALWVGEYKQRRLHKIDANTGKILKTIVSDRFVTGVTWVDGELWHGTWEGDDSDIRRVDPESGDVLERLTLPSGIGCAGVEADDKGRIWFGDSHTGKLHAIKRRA
jgi:outer membrane protein assembly factor BamB